MGMVPSMIDVRAMIGILWQFEHVYTNLGTAKMAKARRLFCPPEREAMGLSARSEDTPNIPRACRYSSSLFPAVWG